MDPDKFMSPELIADGDGQSFLLRGIERLGLYRNVSTRSKECIASEVPSVGCFANS
jgi:hypothetical protein